MLAQLLGPRRVLERGAQGLPAGGCGPVAGYPSTEDAPRGKLQPIAARILMNVLRVAWWVRLHWLRAVGYLAIKITTWASTCGRPLHRLLGYMKKEPAACGCSGGPPTHSVPYDHICVCGMLMLLVVWVVCDPCAGFI